MTLELLTFQREAVSKTLVFLKSRGCFYNASEVGTGKTIMTLATLNELDVNNVLVICPKIVKLVWEMEIKKWYTGKAEFTVINYEALRNENRLNELIAQKFDVLVGDEFHKCKNKSTQVTKAVFGKLWDSVKYKIALSGTPMTQGIPDLFTAYSRMLPEAFDNYYKFCNDFSNRVKTPWATVYRGVKNAETLKALALKYFLFRYKVADVLPQLPNKVFTRVPLDRSCLLEMTPEEKAARDAWVSQLKAAIGNGGYVRPPPKSIQTVLVNQGLKKVSKVTELAEEFLSQGMKIVIFCVHQAVVQAITNALIKYEPCVIYGLTSDEDRALAVDDFQNKSGSVAILSYGAGGVGITLTASSTVILAELDYSAAVIEQGIARVHRHTQKNNVNVYFPVVKDSVDEDVIDIVMAKVKTFNKTFNE